MKKIIRAGCMVRFDFNNEGAIAYGTVKSIDDTVAVVEFKNPITREYDKKNVLLIDLTLIGNA